jgi:phytoene dehydrogenase-like protein
MGIASPFFRSLPIDIPWIKPTAACAHPLEDGTAVMLEHSIEATVATLDACDRSSYRSLVVPLASRFAELVKDILRPVLQFPHHPLLLAQ